MLLQKYFLLKVKQKTRPGRISLKKKKIQDIAHVGCNAVCDILVYKPDLNEKKKLDGLQILARERGVCLNDALVSPGPR